jgi:hypothetical protein
MLSSVYAKSYLESISNKGLTLNTVNKQNASNWEFGIHYSPNYSLFNGVSKFHYTDGDGTIENFGLGYNVGITFKKTFKRIFNFETGLCYNRFSFNYSLPYFGSRNYKYDFVGIPLQLQYNYIRIKNTFFISLGCELNHYMGSNSMPYVKQFFINPFGTVALGIEPKLYRKLYASFSLGFKYAILPYKETYYMGDAGYQEAPQHFYSYFLKTGLLYKL